MVGIDGISKSLKHTLSRIANTQEWPKEWLNNDKIERLRKMAGVYSCVLLWPVDSLIMSWTKKISTVDYDLF